MTANNGDTVSPGSVQDLLDRENRALRDRITWLERRLASAEELLDRVERLGARNIQRKAISHSVMPPK